jgi:hypothetical protein
MQAYIETGEIRPDLEDYTTAYNGFSINFKTEKDIEGFPFTTYEISPPPQDTPKELPEQKQTTVGEDQPKQPKNNIPTTQELPLKRRSQLKSLNGQLIEITVPGDSRRRVGEIIEVDIPSYESRFTEDGTDHSVSGRYMISHIKHVIKKDDYKLVMELSRNSRKQKLPENNEIIEE